MQKFLFAISLILVQSLEIHAQTFGGAGNDKGYFVQQTIDSGFILCGIFKSTYDAIYVIKLDSCANLQWQKVIADTANIGSVCIRQTPDSGFILFGYCIVDSSHGYKNALMIRLNSSGDTLYSKRYRYGTYGDDGVFCHVKSSGNYVFGMVSSTYGHQNLIFFETDTAGNQIWNSIVDSIARPKTSQICATHDGGYTIVWNVGSPSEIHVVKIDSVGNELFRKVFKDTNTYPDYWWGDGICETFDHGFIITGSKAHYLQNTYSKYFKIDSLGNQVFYWGGGGPNWYIGVKEFPFPDHSSVMIGGQWQGITGPTILKLDQVGGHIWKKTIHPSSPAEFHYLEVSRQGNILILGDTTINDSTDVWLIVADSSGNPVSCFFSSLNFFPNKKPDISVISITPNPGDGIFTVFFGEGIFPYSITILDIHGRIVFNSNYHEAQALIDLRMDSPGIYFVQLQTENGTSVQKLVKQ